MGFNMVYMCVKSVIYVHMPRYTYFTCVSMCLYIKGQLEDIHYPDAYSFLLSFVSELEKGSTAAGMPACLHEYHVSRGADTNFRLMFFFFLLCYAAGDMLVITRHISCSSGLLVITRASVAPPCDR